MKRSEQPASGTGQQPSCRPEEAKLPELPQKPRRASGREPPEGSRGRGCGGVVGSVTPRTGGGGELEEAAARGRRQGRAGGAMETLITQIAGEEEM